MSSSSRSSSQDQRSPQRAPCSFFAAGKCRNGAGCKFSHAEPGRWAPAACKFFLQGTCSAGRSCRFSHDPQLLRARRQVSAATRDASLRPGAFGVPCRFFKAGECSAGDKCPYVHVVKKTGKSEEKQQDQEQELVEVEEKQDEKQDIKEETKEEIKENPVNSASERDVTELSEFLTKEEGAELWVCC